VKLDSSSLAKLKDFYYNKKSKYEISHKTYARRVEELELFLRTNLTKDKMDEYYFNRKMMGKKSSELYNFVNRMMEYKYWIFRVPYIRWPEY